MPPVRQVKAADQRLLDRLARLRDQIVDVTGRRDDLFEARTRLFIELRAHGVTHARIAEAAGTSAALVMKELKRAENGGAA